MTATVCGECAWLADLFNAELIRLHSVITAVLLECERLITDVVRGVYGGYSAETSPGAPGPSAEALSGQAWVLLVL